jgi:hypothetical protein
VRTSRRGGTRRTRCTGSCTPVDSEPEGVDSGPEGVDSGLCFWRYDAPVAAHLHSTTPPTDHYWSYWWQFLVIFGNYL